MRISTSDTAGFTLIEILAGTTIFAIIMALLLSVLNSLEATGDIKVTQQRMEKIVVNAKEYYLSRENLPLPHEPATGNPVTTSIVGEIPLTPLHLQAKYRLDSWGRPFHYFTVRNDGDSDNGRPGQILIDPLSAGAPAGAPLAMVDIPQADLTVTPPTGKTLLRGVRINNRPVAGVLISSGPNNIFEYTQTAGYPEQFVLNAGSDDIIIAIDLTPEATQIVQTELKKLGEKVRAFDDRYIGKDNNGRDGYDEDGCNAELYPGDTWVLTRDGNYTDACASCPGNIGNSAYLPIFINQGGNLNDYSCGLPTLDDMKANYWANNPVYGYYYPQIDCYGRLHIDNTPLPDTWGNWQLCTTTPADYYRVPMDLNNPAAADCHWGLVGDPDFVFPNGAVNNELINDQTRAAIYCAYGLSPSDIIDPWLNGYVWGCGIENGISSGQGGNSCANDYQDTDPRFHKFYSAGPDGMIGSDADGDGNPDDLDGNGYIDVGDDIVAPL